MLNDGYERAQFERDCQEPLAGNIQAAQMLEKADRLKDTIRNLENEREAIISLHLNHMPFDLREKVFESYDNEIANRKQELAEISESLAERGYIA